MTPLIKIIRTENAPADHPLPVYQSEGAAGMDLYACIEEPVTPAPHKPVLIPSGVAIALPTNEFAAFIYARSGLASKHGISLANGVGVVDSDYRGEIKVALINLTDTEYTINPRDRIAQLVIAPVCVARVVLEDELPQTERGAGGFGSTGR